MGPAGEILRLAGERAAHLHGEVDAALREGLSEFAEPDGTLVAPASTWIVSARRLSTARPLRPLPLAALAIACALALVVAYVVFVRTHAGQRIDEAALNGRLGSMHARAPPISC